MSNWLTEEIILKLSLAWVVIWLSLIATQVVYSLLRTWWKSRREEE